ncbi:MAG TPA: DUF6512 family protein [Candidatus Bathyarchaeia archaeon]|nr:DUF6512 family protein [Candidatus Bathyarchaeia archaeon]
MHFRTIDEIEEHKKTIRIWYIVGGVAIFSLGALWHFIFAWTDGWAPIGWLLPVNESVWEHVKLMFWPALIFYGIESIFLYKKTNNYLIAKTTTFYFIPIMSISIFFTVYGATGFESFIFDTIVLALLTVASQFISYKIVTAEPIAEKRHLVLIIIAIILTVLLATLLIVFTYVTPHIPLFEHEFANETGLYGILPNY